MVFSAASLRMGVLERRTLKCSTLNLRSGNRTAAHELTYPIPHTAQTEESLLGYRKQRAEQR